MDTANMRRLNNVCSQIITGFRRCLVQCDNILFIARRTPVARQLKKRLIVQYPSSRNSSRYDITVQRCVRVCRPLASRYTPRCVPTADDMRRATACITESVFDAYNVTFPATSLKVCLQSQPRCVCAVQQECTAFIFSARPRKTYLINHTRNCNCKGSLTREASNGNESMFKQGIFREKLPPKIPDPPKNISAKNVPHPVPS